MLLPLLRRDSDPVALTLFTSLAAASILRTVPCPDCDQLISADEVRQLHPVRDVRGDGAALLERLPQPRQVCHRILGNPVGS